MPRGRTPDCCARPGAVPRRAQPADGRDGVRVCGRARIRRDIVVPVDRLREIVAGNPALGDLILRAFIIRRSILIGLGTGLRIIGSRPRPTPGGCASSRRATGSRTAGSTSRRIPPRTRCWRAGVDAGETPVVIWSGKVLRNPTNAELAAALGLERLAGRPATWSWSARSRRSGRRGLRGVGGPRHDAPGRSRTGGQAATSARIENYLGFPAGISGASWQSGPGPGGQVRRAAQLPPQATSLAQRRRVHVVRLADGAETDRTVIIATGARYRRLDDPRLEEFEGDERLLRRHGGRSPAVPSDRSRSSAAATRPGRPRCSSEHVPRVHRLVRGERPQSECRATWSTASSESRTSRSAPTEVTALIGTKRLGGGPAIVDPDRARADGRSSRLAALFVFIGASRTRGGSGINWPSIGADSSRPVAMSLGRESDRLGRQRPCSLRRAVLACSPPATCAAAPSSAWRRQSATARSRFAWSGSTSAASTISTARPCHSRVDRRRRRPSAS